jgi:CheY-like chemotaxis protein
VVDTGIGIPPALLPRIFDLFVQGERSLDRAEGGLGIGLTLVRRLAELHGGEASVSSEGEGRGSTFTVRLPALDPVPTVRAAPAPAAARQRSVLIVEDNDDARDTLRMLLEMLGHQVDTAPDGVAGLERALEVQPDVLLVDLGLPGIDGFEVARRYRAAGGRGTLVALTGYGGADDRVRALEAGFDRHVSKPVDLDVLTDLLASG